MLMLTGRHKASAMLGTASARSTLLLSVLLLTGCATIAHGPNQSVVFTSMPAGATVEVDGKVRGTTPTTVVLPREKKTYDVRVTKDGYMEATAQLIAEVSGWIWGNLAIGGLFGIVVDMATGAMNNLTPERLDVTLTPIERGAADVAPPREPVREPEAAPTPAPAPILPPPAVAAQPPAPEKTPTRPDLRTWAAGRWRSTGGTNELVIGPDLSWTWSSSAGGSWTGRGRGEAHGETLVLQGWSYRSTSVPMTLRLSREEDALVGVLQTTQTYPLIFLRQ